MEKSKYPVGIQSFREIRERGLRYVDKTMFIESLMHDTKNYFLSRPRRFGKSLFISTLKELFEGRDDLFEGLSIHPIWDWSKTHPVVHLDLSEGDFTQREALDNMVMEQISWIEEIADVASTLPGASARFSRLIKQLRRKTGRTVVVLVDECDKPILDAITDPATARVHRDNLRGIFSVIKSRDDDIRFCLLTGVSRFSKASIFSGINNL